MTTLAEKKTTIKDFVEFLKVETENITRNILISDNIELNKAVHNSPVYCDRLMMNYLDMSREQAVNNLNRLSFDGAIFIDSSDDLAVKFGKNVTSAGFDVVLLEIIE